ncbi:MAG: glycosyltransferase family 1 protein [bacterium]|nr:glycosyltransferase family 1 protein [bacterium]
MRVAIFAETFLPKWDGVANTTCHLLDHLAARGHESMMIAPEGAPASYASTPILGRPCFALPMYPALRLVTPRPGLGSEILDFKPDIVHLINPALLGISGLHRAREAGVPVVASYHTDLPGYLEKYNLTAFRDFVWNYFRWLHNQADLNLCPTRFIRCQLAERGFERLEIWGRGVDSHIFSPGRRSRLWRERLTAGHPEAPLLVYVGRLAIEKRVEVIRPVLDELPHVRLAIIGDGPERARLEEVFAGTNTVFTGYLTGDDLPDAYAAGDIFVFPGENETFGNVVLEAMASGLPALVASHSGLKDHTRNGWNGFQFEPGNGAQLATLVRWLLSDPDYRARLAANALDYARGLTWEQNLDGLIGHYERLVAAHRRDGAAAARTPEGGHVAVAAASRLA